MQFTLRQLTYLVAVADHGSVTAAAQALYTSQPGISTAITQLEALFGLQIFIRHPARGVSLTPAGQCFVAAARNMLAHADDLLLRGGELNQSLRGTLDLGCFTTLGPILLPKWLASFQDQYPDIEVRLHEGDIAQLQDALECGRIEVALLYDLDLSPALIKFPLKSIVPYALMSPRHPLAAKPSVSLAELADEPMVLLDLPYSRAYFLSLFRQHDLEPVIRHRTVNFELVRGMVAAGNGYALLNMRPHINVTYGGDPLVCLPIADRVPPLSIVLAWSRALRPTRRADAFIGMCRMFVQEGKVI